MIDYYRTSERRWCDNRNGGTDHLGDGHRRNTALTFTATQSNKPLTTSSGPARVVVVAGLGT